MEFFCRKSGELAYPEIYVDKDFTIQCFARENVNADESRRKKNMSEGEHLRKTVWKRLRKDFKCVKLKLTT